MTAILGLLIVVNAAIAIFFFYRNFIKINIFFLLWGSILFFVVFPMTIDAYFLIREDPDYIFRLDQLSPSGSYDILTIPLLTQIAFFVLLFNFCILLGQCFTEHFISAIWKRRETYTLIGKNYFPYWGCVFLIILEILLLFSGYRGFLNFSDGIGNEKISSFNFCLALYCFFISGLYIALENKKVVLILIFIFLSFIISIQTSMRPFFIPVIGLLLFYFYEKKCHNAIKIRYIIAVGIIAFLMIALLQFIRTQDIHKISLLMYPMARDSSYNEMLFAFDCCNEMYGTEGGGILSLAFFHKIFVLFDFLPKPVSEMLEPTRYLALARWRWPVGTLHPTIYGWAFVDLKWWGTLLGGFIGIYGAFVNTLFSSPSTKPFCISLLAFFFIIAVRGSLLYAFSYTFYSFAVTILYILCSNGIMMLKSRQ